MKKTLVILFASLLVSTFSIPMAAAESTMTALSGWTKNSATLSARQSENLRSWYNTISNRVVEVKCNWTFQNTDKPEKRKLSQKRAQAACSRIKQFAPKITVETSSLLTKAKTSGETVSISAFLKFADDGISATKPTNECRISSSGSGWNSVGFPLSTRFKGAETWIPLKSVGKIKALVIVVDFEKFPGSADIQHYVSGTLYKTNEFFKTISYGKVQFDFTVLPKYVRMPSNPETYGIGAWNSGVYRPYYVDALNSAARDFDISGYDAVYVVSTKEVPLSVITPGPAFPGPEVTVDGIVPLGAATGNLQSDEQGFRWLAHETGHLFGLVDLYDVTGTIAGATNRHTHFGQWDIMSENWNSKMSLEFNSWFRFQLGWLDDPSVICLDIDSLDVSGINLATLRDSSGTRSIVIRLGNQRVVVIERRGPGPFSAMRISDQGVIVYEVDGAAAFNQAPMTLIRKNFIFFDTALSNAALKLGEQVEFENLRISVKEENSNSSFVTLQKISK